MNKCWECDETNVPLHNHHPVPRSRGGTRTIPLCEPCHSKAHHRDKNMTTSKLNKEATERLRKAGKRYSGKAPWGYRFEGDDIVEDSKEQEQIMLIIELRKTSTWKQVEEEFYNAGHRNRKGGRMGKSHIHTSLRKYLANRGEQIQDLEFDHVKKKKRIRTKAKAKKEAAEAKALAKKNTIEQAASVIKELEELYFSMNEFVRPKTISHSIVADTLNSRGITNFRGGQWNKPQVMNLRKKLKS